LLIDNRAFSKLSEGDQAVVREVMEGIYRKFDRYGVADNQKALQALLDNGLELVSPDAVDVSEWRTIVNDSHRQMAIDGTFDIELLDRVQELIEYYRSDAAAVAH
jgi:TRAP-type C4-dicarboxylate transport system substrate-binding protein